MKKILPFLILAAFLQSCMYYYKVQTVKPVGLKEIRQYDSLQKYLVLHQGDSAWCFSDLSYDIEQVSGKLSVLPDDHLKYRTTNPEKGNRYKKPEESMVLQEVHLFVKDTLLLKFAGGDSIQISFSSLKKAEVYKKDKGKTTASWLLPALGGAVVVGGVFAIIVGSSINSGIVKGSSLSFP